MASSIRRSMRPALTAILLGALGLAAALLVACGGEGGKLLPAERAGDLRAALDAVQAACASGDVAGAEAAALQLRDRIAELSPREVDRRLIANLREGAGALDGLIGTTCAPVETTPTTPTETVPPETVPTTPTTTVPTTPTTPTTTEPPPTTTLPPATTPDPGGGPGGGGANGNGPGGGGAPGQSGGATPEEEAP